MWKDEEYHYSIGLLRDVAQYHEDPIIEINRKGLIRGVITDPFSIAEYHADFDRAFGILSRESRAIIKEDMNGKLIPEHESDKRKIYWRMATFLNYGL